MIEYYNRRAKEYDAMWRRDEPVRQAEQAAIADALQRLFQGGRVLEVACGTGYWTQFVAAVAEKVLATDASAEMLKVAAAKGLPSNVELKVADAYRLETAGQFNGGLANFWFSHVPKERISEFLHSFHAALQPGSLVFMADNVFVEGVGGELVRRPKDANTYKLRTLADGSKHEVLKNYHSADELRVFFGPDADDLQIHMGKCFWWLQYRLR